MDPLVASFARLPGDHRMGSRTAVDRGPYADALRLDTVAGARGFRGGYSPGSSDRVGSVIGSRDRGRHRGDRGDWRRRVDVAQRDPGWDREGGGGPAPEDRGWGPGGGRVSDTRGWGRGAKVECGFGAA
ncbi:uncharacterized protein A4U43_C02F5660 [Asparagus officinalis]|uniref:Uncharacterized protein n=1 Tax=Asparagus officinalis TaxID=4686 RepID=A0A5P1FH01_ASPOF|nr:uncharacterized protein A4U43_C02F5660 [Asparagus officinalis]